MLDLISEFEKLKNKKMYPYMSGSVENVFVYNERCQKNEDGSISVIFKPDPIESKKKKSLT